MFLLLWKSTIHPVIYNGLPPFDTRATPEEKWRFSLSPSEGGLDLVTNRQVAI